jgi:hypothetical protein
VNGLWNISIEGDGNFPENKLFGVDVLEGDLVLSITTSLRVPTDDVLEILTGNISLAGSPSMKQLSSRNCCSSEDRLVCTATEVSQ